MVTHIITKNEPQFYLFVAFVSTIFFAAFPLTKYSISRDSAPPNWTNEEKKHNGNKYDNNNFHCSVRSNGLVRWFVDSGDDDADNDGILFSFVYNDDTRNFCRYFMGDFNSCCLAFILWCRRNEQQYEMLQSVTLAVFAFHGHWWCDSFWLHGATKPFVILSSFWLCIDIVHKLLLPPLLSTQWSPLISWKMENRFESQGLMHFISNTK